MRFFSFLCSILIHIGIIILALYLPRGSHKVNLNSQHIYNVQIIKLKPKKTLIKSKKTLIHKKTVKIKRIIPSRNIIKKKIVKIPIKKTKKRHKIPVKINPNILKQKIIKSALSEIKSSIKAEEKQESLIQKEINTLKKHITPDNPININNSDTEIYGKVVEQKIKENWRYPLLKNLELKTSIQLIIDKNGNIIDIKIIKRSGDNLFDNSIIKAIKETKELPKPPGGKVTLIIDFDSRELQ